MNEVVEESIENVKAKWDTILSETSNSTIGTKKNNIDFVTLADEKVESIIRESIHSMDKESSIIGEEFDNSLSEEDGTYYIDPIDGTFNFARGLPEYCVSIAYEENSDIECVGLYFPHFDFTLYSYNGKIEYEGDFFDNQLQGDPVPSEKSELDGASIGIDVISSTLEPLNEYRNTLQEDNVVRQPMCVIYSSLMVASGAFDCSVFSGLHPWDIAPGYHIVNNVGGKITTEEGDSDWEKIRESEVVVVSGNSDIHDDFLNLIG